ncbi:hypothetical protein BSKO_09872 [Bryopsis sp. KO-2023]|nr:hypothetical protein BSKO_09872 [Bryopsis sp. KO-2023]
MADARGEPLQQSTSLDQRNRRASCPSEIASSGTDDYHEDFGSASEAKARAKERHDRERVLAGRTVTQSENDADNITPEFIEQALQDMVISSPVMALSRSYSLKRKVDDKQKHCSHVLPQLQKEPSAGKDQPLGGVLHLTDSEREAVFFRVFETIREGLHARIGDLDVELEQMVEFETKQHTATGIRVPWVRWKKSPLRHQIHTIMCDPTSSRLAWAVSIGVLVLIILSCVIINLETIPSLESNEQLFKLVELVTIVAFTLEYVVKLVTAPDITAFFFNIFNLVDLLAIAPFYLELMFSASDDLSSTRILRAVRLVRIFRVLKLGSKINKIQVVMGAVIESLDMLGMLFFLLMLALVLFSSLVYFAEQGSDNEDLNSIPRSFWWCIVTLMTVGYGDVVPKSIQGQLVACLAMLSSILIMALPISVIGANFTTQWADFKQKAKVIARTTNVWCQFMGMNTMFDQYLEVMEELNDNVRECQTCIDQEVITVRSTARAARNVYMNRVAVLNSDSERTAKTIRELKRLLARMKRQYHLAWELCRETKHIMVISQAARPNEIVSRLEQINTAYKKLKKWSNEGHHISKEVNDLSQKVEEFNHTSQKE